MMTAIFVSRILPLNSNNTGRGRLVLTLFCLISLLLLLASSAQARSVLMPVVDSSDTPGAPPTAEIEFVDYVGGAVTALAVHGDYAYLGVSIELVIVDISESSFPRLVGHLLLADKITGILVDNTDFIYVITASYLQVIDISQPEHLIQRGNLAFENPRTTQGATIFGSHLYFSTNTERRLTVVDISDPDHLLITNELGGTVVYQVMTIDRGYLYGIAMSDFGFGVIQIWDLSNPNFPQKVYDQYDYDWPGFRNIVISGHYAYIGGLGGSAMTIVMDISDPAGIRQVAAWDFGVQVVIDQYAYTGSQIWDISDPTKPMEVRSDLPEPLYYHGYNDHNIVVASDSIYLLYGNSLHILDVTDRVLPKLSGNYQLRLIDSQKVSVLGDRIVYPGSPLWKYDDAMSVISDDYLYQVYQFCSKWCSPITLEILDVSNPYQPWPVLSTLTLPVLPEFISVQQDRLFLLGRPYGQPFQMQIVDVSDPSNPTWLGVYTDATIFYYGAIATLNDYVFITSGDAGIRVIDISTPREPQQVALIQIQGWVGVVQDHLFVLQRTYNAADPHDELVVYDVSDPAHPAWLHSIRLQEQVMWFTASDPYLYMTTDGGGLLIFDASNPTALERIASYTGFSYGAALILNKNYIFVPANDYFYFNELGLHILWFSPPVRKAISADNSETLAVPDGPAYVFPANSFSQPVTVTHQARYPKNTPSAGSLTATDIVFKVQAHNDAGQLAQPQSPYSLTVPYTSKQAAAIIPQTLSLYFWDGDMWQREASSHVDTERQLITAQPNRMGLWAVLGESHHLYLPTIRSRR